MDSYEQDMNMGNTADSPWLGGDALASVELPVPEDFTFVIVDIETTGFHAETEIVQVAAKCGEREFSEYILPQGYFAPEASDVTGLSVRNGQLHYEGEVVPTISSNVAAENFMEFLRKCGGPIVLVGHNIIRFDAPRIMKWLSQCGLAKDFVTCTHGFVDTLPLISQGKLKRLDLLANEYLTTPESQDLIKRAHNASADCSILESLLQKFKINDKKLKSNVKSLRSFMEDQARVRRRKENVLALQPLLNAKISLLMVNRMAEHGVTIDELVEAHRSGPDGVKTCLSVKVDGKPRITAQKRICDQITSLVVDWLQKVPTP